MFWNVGTKNCVSLDNNNKFVYIVILWSTWGDNHHWKSMNQILCVENILFFCRKCDKSYSWLLLNIRWHNNEKEFLPFANGNNHDMMVFDGQENENCTKDWVNKKLFYIHAINFIFSLKLREACECSEFFLDKYLIFALFIQ